MAGKSILDQPIRRGRTKKERIAILRRIAVEVRSNPELREAARKFVRITTH